MGRETPVFSVVLHAGCAFAVVCILLFGFCGLCCSTVLQLPSVTGDCVVPSATERPDQEPPPLCSFLLFVTQTQALKSVQLCRKTVPDIPDFLTWQEHFTSSICSQSQNKSRHQCCVSPILNVFKVGHLPWFAP